MPANIIGIQEQGADLSDLYVSPAEAAELDRLGYLTSSGADAYGIDYGTLWAWGQNNQGELGLSDSTMRSTPIQVGSLTNWKQVNASYYHSAAVKSDGTLWAWGYNLYGSLGQGDRTDRSSPVQVGSLTNWKQVSTGDLSTSAVKTDGTLWSWGYNATSSPALGLNDSTHRSSPVQVGSLTNWKQVSVGNSGYAIAIKTDGTLWSWGGNNYGQLGLSNFTIYSSPVQVGTLTNWRQISCGDKHSAAVKTDGTLWTWGYNAQTALGLGDTVHRSSPTQIGTATNWRQVSCGYAATLATKVDGTLWAWGYDLGGSLGLNSLSPNVNSPVQVGALSNWKTVTNHYGFTLATKVDGTLWAWGVNSYGQLGLGDITNRSSPVQVGSLTNWKQTAGGRYHSLVTY